MSTRLLKTVNIHYAAYLLTTDFKLRDMAVVDNDFTVECSFESPQPGLDFANHFKSWSMDLYSAPARALLRNYVLLRDLMEKCKDEAKGRNAKKRSG